MHSYAISVPDKLFMDGSCQSAFASAKIKKIEFSCSASVTREQRLQEIANLARMQAEGSVKVASIHLPFGADWWLNNTDEPIRSKSVANARQFIEDCLPLNCKLLTVHGSVEVVPTEPKERAECMAACRRSIAELVPTAAEYGIFLNLEDLPRTCLANTPEELAEMVEGFPYEQVGICYDVNHFCNMPERVAEGIRMNAKRIRSFHISDYDGIDECHWYPGLGVIDWADVMAAVRALPNDVLLIFESFGFLNPEAWQKRGSPLSIRLNSFVRNVFYLENAAELQERINQLTIDN